MSASAFFCGAYGSSAAPRPGDAGSRSALRRGARRRRPTWDAANRRASRNRRAANTSGCETLRSVLSTSTKPRSSVLSPDCRSHGSGAAPVASRRVELLARKAGDDQRPGLDGGDRHARPVVHLASAQLPHHARRADRGIFRVQGHLRAAMAQRHRDLGARRAGTHDRDALGDAEPRQELFVGLDRQRARRREATRQRASRR